MRILIYISGIPVYILIAFITMPVLFITKWMSMKLFSTTDLFYFGMLDGWIVSALFIFSMKILFKQIDSDIPLIFIMLVIIPLFFNNYKRVKTGKNKYNELGYLVGEGFGMTAFYVYSINNLTIF